MSENDLFPPFPPHQVVDGWEMNQQYFPSPEDHQQSIEGRLHNLCGQLVTKTFLSSQNVALIQHLVTTPGEGFTVSVRFRRNPQRKYICSTSSASRAAIPPPPPSQQGCLESSSTFSCQFKYYIYLRRRGGFFIFIVLFISFFRIKYLIQQKQSANSATFLSFTFFFKNIN